MRMLLFLKAKLPGSGGGDLFTSTVDVAGYTTKDGTYVGPHQATRRKAVDRPGPAGRPASQAKANLFSVAAQNGKPVERERVVVDSAVNAAFPGLRTMLQEMVPRFAPGAHLKVQAGARGMRCSGIIYALDFGSFEIHLDLHTPRSETARLKTLLHEVGHMALWTSLAAADPATRQAVIAQWGQETNQTAQTCAMVSWLNQGLPEDVLQPSARGLGTPGNKHYDGNAYARQFHEWQAEKSAAWLLTEKEPAGLVDQYFKAMADTLRSIYQAAARMLGFAPKDGALEALMRDAWRAPGRHIPYRGEANWYENSTLPPYQFDAVAARTAELTKAALPGGAANDLFAQTVSITGYTTKDGTYVAPHEGLRRKAAERTVIHAQPRHDDLFAPRVVPIDEASVTGASVADIEAHPDAALDLASYDHVLVMFSGGKDSVAAVLRLIEMGVDKSKLELWHHDIDGDGRNLMDWPITPAYCRAFAKALGVPIYFSYREGGFEREMNRRHQATAAVKFDQPDGTIGQAGGQSDKLGTREKFPQTSADLKVRWCSGALKVDVGAIAIRNQARFLGKRTLVVTGERGQESANRAKYKVLEPDRTHTQSRHVDHYRAVHAYKEEDVWETMARHGVVPHPAYQLGYGRLSCRNCVFGGPDQWATNRALYPDSVATIAAYEKQFNTTINRTANVHERADKGQAYAAAVSQPELARLADSKEWDGSPVIVDPAEWRMPAGALNKDKSGPS